MSIVLNDYGKDFFEEVRKFRERNMKHQEIGVINSISSKMLSDYHQVVINYTHGFLFNLLGFRFEQMRMEGDKVIWSSKDIFDLVYIFNELGPEKYQSQKQFATRNDIPYNEKISIWTVVGSDRRIKIMIIRPPVFNKFKEELDKFAQRIKYLG